MVTCLPAEGGGAETRGWGTSMAGTASCSPDSDQQTESQLSNQMKAKRLKVTEKCRILFYVFLLTNKHDAAYAANLKYI